MHGKLGTLAVCAAVVFGFIVQANEKPTEAYQKAMKDLNAAVNSLRVHVKDLDYPAIQKDGAAMKGPFATVLQFWTDKKVDDAMMFAQTGAKGAADLETAAMAQNLNAVLAAQAEVAGSPSTGTGTGVYAVGVCAPCHLAHRQRLPDGTFEIK